MKSAPADAGLVAAEREELARLGRVRQRGGIGCS